MVTGGQLQLDVNGHALGCREVNQRDPRICHGQDFSQTVTGGPRQVGSQPVEQVEWSGGVGGNREASLVGAASVCAALDLQVSLPGVQVLTDANLRTG